MRILLISTLSFSLLALGLAASLYVQKPKHAIIDTIRLVDNYELKKAMEAENDSKLIPMKKELDSLSTMLKNDSDEGNNSHQILKATYMHKYQQFQQQWELSSREINETVWKRLNPLIHEFGKDNDYDVLIGANGMGTVLYSSQEYDITSEFINYANEQFRKGR